MSTLAADLRFALRLFARGPGFTALVVVTLALGVGANAAIFSVVNAVLLRPLPYRYADRTVLLWNAYDPSGSSTFAVSPPEYFDLEEQLRAFDQVAAITKQQSAIVGDGGEPEQLTAYVVTPNTVDLLGAAPGVHPGDPFHPDLSGVSYVIVAGGRQ